MTNYKSFTFKNIHLTYIFLPLILICTFLIFSNTLDHKLLNWDDGKHISDNPYIKTLDKSTFKNLYTYDKHTSLTLLTFSITYKFWKLNPFAYHLTNVLIHVLNVLLVFVLIFKISKNNIVTYASTILFAWHPLRVESVAWISERKDLLFVFFSLLTILFYLKYLRDNHSFKWYLIVLLLAWFASLSKIQAVVLPVLLLTIDVYYKRKIRLVAILEKLVIFYIIFMFKAQLVDLKLIHLFRLCILLITVFICQYLDKHRIKTYAIILFLLLFTLFGYGAKLMYFYIPFTLWFVYEYFLEPIKSYQEFFNRYKKYILVSLISISIICTFVITIVYHPFSFWLNSLNSDIKFSFFHRIFLGGYSMFFYLFKFIFPFYLNAMNSYPVLDDGWLPVVYYFFTGIILIIFSIALYYIFKNKKKLTEYIFWITFFFINISLVLHFIPIEGRLVVADRYTYFAYLGLFVITGYVLAYLSKNKTHKPYALLIFIFICTGFSYQTYTRNKIWKNNFTLYGDVLKKDPTNYFAHWNMGTALLEDKQFSEAILHFNKALQLHPTKNDKSDIFCNRGWAKFNLSDNWGSIRDYKVSLVYNNKNSIALNNLGWAYAGLNQFDKANAEINKGISIDSSVFILYINRGIIKINSNDYYGAIEDFNKAIKLNPDYYFAYNNIGWAKFKLQQYIDAISYFNSALSIKPDFELCLYNRGLAKLNIRDFNGAILDFKSSTDINPIRLYNYYYCGWAYYYLHQADMACSYWKSALEKGCPEAKSPLDSYCK